MWYVASLLGVLGLGATLVGLALLAYAAISHLGRPDKQVPWHWTAGVVPLAICLFAGGLLLQVVSFVARIALGGS